MISDKDDAIIKGQQYTIAARCYFDMEEDGTVRFKGGNAEHTLTYCYETGEWQCDCLEYTAREPCAHTNAAEKSLPVPASVVVQ